MIEQWGENTAGTNTSLTTIFPISFSNNTIPCIQAHVYNNQNTQVTHDAITSVTTTQFVMQRWYSTGYTGSGLPVFWYVKGY